MSIEDIESQYGTLLDSHVQVLIVYIWYIQYGEILHVLCLCNYIQNIYFCTTCIFRLVHIYYKKNNKHSCVINYNKISV